MNNPTDNHTTRDVSVGAATESNRPSANKLTTRQRLQAILDADDEISQLLHEMRERRDIGKHPIEDSAVRNERGF